MTTSRPPRAILKPFVALLWAAGPPAAPPPDGGRELVLPTGALHLVIRLADHPLRLFRDMDDRVGTTIGGPVIGGARSGPYLKDVSIPTPTVGAMIRPGAAGAVLGAPAGAFTGAHVALDEVWGAGPAAEIRERLEATRSLAARLDLFEAILAARLPPVRGMHPMIARALAGFRAQWSVGDVVREIGCSHRHFATVFRTEVGLGPKAFGRVMRFRRSLRGIADDRPLSWADLAAAEGYADQAHFVREFRAFAGVTPGRYRRIAPASPHHVPLAE